MRQHVISSGLNPAPWGEPATDWPLLVRPTRSWTEEALISATCPSSLKDHSLVYPDNLLLSPEFVSDFFTGANSAASGGTFQAFLGPGDSARRSAGRSSLASVDGALPLPLLLCPPGSESLPQTMAELLSACAQASPVVVDPQEKTQTFPAPRAYGDDGQDHIKIAASTRIALWLEHRSHLQQANLELLGATFVRSMGRPKFLLALRYLYERWRPGARRLFSKIGPRCTIHPTAIIEASSIGAGCSIGAYAIVRGSVLGEDAVIEDAAHVHMSSIGPSARVARQTSVFACVLMEGAHSAQAVMQMSVLGEHSATTSASWFSDVRLTGNVQVEGEAGGLLDSGTKFLGCDMGHNSFIGAGVTVAPGRMLPSNARIVADPRAVLSKLGSVDPTGGGGAIFVVSDGSLERLP